MSTDDRNKGSTSTGRKEVTDVRALGKKNHLALTPLARKPCVSNGRNQKQYSLANMMIVLGARVRHTWLKSPALSLTDFVTLSRLPNLSEPPFFSQVGWGEGYIYLIEMLQRSLENKMVSVVMVAQ